MLTRSAVLLLLLIAAWPALAQTEAKFIKADTTTQGNWKASYGAEGYQVVNDRASYPSYARVNAVGQASYTWHDATEEVRVLQRGSVAERIAATWFSAATFSVTVALTDGAPHQVALYFLDWDRQGRAEQVEVVNASNGAVLDRRAVANFGEGVYLVWQLSGNISFRITRTAGPNAVLSGLFFGQNAPPSPPGPTAPATASFVKIDDRTGGNWKGGYGAEGYVLAAEVASKPVNASVSVNTYLWTWAATTDDSRGLQRPTTNGRFAATWYAWNSLNIEIEVSAGSSQQVAFYFVDWDHLGRAQTIEVSNAATGARLDMQVMSGFTNGRYLVWNISGRVNFRMTRVAGVNAVVSGLFFGQGGPTQGQDSAAPVISGVASSAVTAASARITWTTDELADTGIEYGPTTAYGNVTNVASPLVTDHQLNLLGLMPGTLYHYRVLSKDAAGNQARSGDYTFTTAAAPPGEPELPRAYLDTTFRPPTGNIITVNAGGNLQAALYAAQPGDTIVLEAGATFIAPGDGFVLPNKSNPQGQWIVVRTANLASLPPAGARATPAHAAAMPKLVTNTYTAVMATERGADFWRLIGIEFTVAAGPLAVANQNAGRISHLVALGDAAERDINYVPTDLVLDRCYVHGAPNKNVGRGVLLNSRRTAIIDSYIADIHETGADTQAICGWNGPGPHKIVNNYLEAAGENVMFGGGDPAINNLIPSDIEMRGNHFAKPLSWRLGAPEYAGFHWSVKNLFELKNAQRVLIDGNLLENCWADAQNGVAVVLTPRNQEGSAPWSAVRDVTFINNIVRRAGGGVSILGYDNIYPSAQTTRILIRDNLFDEIDGARWGGGGRLFQVFDGADRVTIDHNTALVSGHVILADSGNGRLNTGFVFTNNISLRGCCGVGGSGQAEGTGTLNYYFPGYVFKRNAIIGANAAAYPGDNFFPATPAAVGFVNYAGGDYRLSSTSSYLTAGTDGRPLGANIGAALR